MTGSSIEYKGDTYVIPGPEKSPALLRALSLCDAKIFEIKPSPVVTRRISKALPFDINNYQLRRGRRFGSWEVTGKSQRTGKPRQYRPSVPVRCLCGCGIETFKRYHTLMSGEAKGCTAYDRKRSANNQI